MGVPSRNAYSDVESGRSELEETRVAIRPDELGYHWQGSRAHGAYFKILSALRLTACVSKNKAEEQAAASVNKMAAVGQINSAKRASLGVHPTSKQAIPKRQASVAIYRLLANALRRGNQAQLHYQSVHAYQSKG